MPFTDYQRGSIFGLTLAAVAFAFALSMTPDNKPAAQQTDRQTPTHSEQKGKSPIERWWTWTVTGDSSGFYTFGLIFVGAAQAGFFMWQLDLIRRGLADTKDAAEASKEQARLARESLIASNRAWIKVEVQIKNDLKYSAGEWCAISLELTFENIGRSPAFNVNCMPEMMASTNDRRPREALDASFVSNSLFRKGGGNGFNIMPGERVSHDYGLKIDAEHIASGGLGYSTRIGQESSGSSDYMRLQIYGTVTYSDPLEDVWRHTPFIYDLGYADGRGVVLKYGPDIPADDLRLRPSTLGAIRLD